MNGDENLIIISPPGWRRVAMYFPLANGYQIQSTNQRREQRRASGSRRTKRRRDFFSTENQNGDWFGQRSGGKWRFDGGSPFSTGEERGASPETSDFRCNFRFTRLLIVRERVGVESKVTPLSNSQGMSSLLGSIMGMTDDRR